MRDFTWHVFTQTGDIEAYLLYKEVEAGGTTGGLPEQPEADEEGSLPGDVFGFGE